MYAYGSRSLHQSKNLPKHYEVLFTGSELPSGSTELSQVQRDKRKLGTMCHALIAKRMFTPNLDTYTGDDTIIESFTREDSARASVWRARTTVVGTNKLGVVPVWSTGATCELVRGNVQCGTVLTHGRASSGISLHIPCIT